MANNGYVGKIGHGGTQKVQAPNPGTGKRGQSAVKKGEDLRVKKGNK